MLFKSQKINKNASEGADIDEHVEEDPAGKGFVKRSKKVHTTFTNRTSLINGLTVAEQDPVIRRPKADKKGTEGKKKVGGSSALLKK